MRENVGLEWIMRKCRQSFFLFHVLVGISVRLSTESSSSAASSRAATGSTASRRPREHSHCFLQAVLFFPSALRVARGLLGLGKRHLVIGHSRFWIGYLCDPCATQSTGRPRDGSGFVLWAWACGPTFHEAFGCFVCQSVSERRENVGMENSFIAFFSK